MKHFIRTLSFQTAGKSVLLSLKWSQSPSVGSDSLQPQGLYSPGNSPGPNTGVGSLSLLQGIFPSQGSNPGLPHCRQILYQLSHKGSPSILEWVAYPFSRRSSQPRNWTGVSSLQADSFLTIFLTVRNCWDNHAHLWEFHFWQWQTVVRPIFPRG